MRRTFFALIATAFISLPSLAMAHETAIVPQVEGPYITGQTVPFTMIASHTFPSSDELEAAESMAATFDGTDLALAPNETILAYEGAATLTKSGAAIIRGHRLAELWSNTPRGWLKGGRDEHKNSVATYKYEKFSKAILSVDGQTDGFDAIVGDKLEIVPMDNILTAKVGDEVRVQFLFDGKPITPARVTATYAGFSNEPNTWAFMTEPSDNTALIKLHHAGLWMVRIEHTDYVATDTHTAHNLRATLVFTVK